VIDKATRPGIVRINFNKQGKTVFYYDYKLLARAGNASQLKGFNPADVNLPASA
jgi:hypothetical protein